jgi:hypothetical protein
MKGVNMIPVDILNEEPIKVARKTKATDFDIEVKEEISVFNKDMFQMGTLIFNIQDTCNKYGIEYDTLIVLCYLNELTVFKHPVKVIDRTLYLPENKALGFIVNDFKVKSKDYYRITDYGKEVVSYFYSTLKSNNNAINKNRVLDFDAEGEMNSALSGYFSSI